MQFKKFYLLIAMLLSLIASNACIKSCSASRDTNQSISVSLGFPIETIDPRYATSAAASNASKLVYAPLFVLGEDLTPEPFLASSVESLDEKTFKITLRKGLQFHDLSPLTADDVVYTFASLGSTDVASPHADKFNYIKDIRSTSATEVIVELQQPFAAFLTDICALGIVSKKSCEKRSQQCRHEYNGSGPFKVKKWDTAKEVVELEPFLAWYEGAPKNGVLLRVVRDENTRLLELMGKKADLVESDISPQNIIELKKQSHLAIEEIKGLGYSYLAMNVRGPRPEDKAGTPLHQTRSALAEKAVRMAIAHAIDFDKIIEKIFLGSAERVSGLIPNGHWAKDPSLKLPPFDPKLAEKELDEAGFPRQVSNKNMRFHVVIATTPNRMRQSIAQLYKDYLSKVGIDSTVRVKEWGALYQDIKQGNFEIFSANWVPVTEPDLYYYVHHSASIPRDNENGGNRHGFKNAEVDKLIEAGRTTMAPEERKLIYHQIERLMLEELPYIPLWNEHRIVVYNKERLQGFVADSSGSLLGLRKAFIGSLTKKAALD